jgi:hypothetical protein
MAAYARPEDLHGAAERRSLHRAVAAIALGAAKATDPKHILRSAWPEDHRATIMLRAASNPIDSTTYPGLDAVTTLPQLAPQSAAMKLFARGARLDLAGKRTISVPDIAVPPAPVFVAEGAPGPVLQFAFGKTALGPAKKVLIFSAVSRELEQATPEGAITIISRILSDAASKGVDVVALGSGAGDAITPAGLLVGATPLAAAAAGVDAWVQDIAALTQAVADAFVDPVDIVFLAAPRQAQALRLKASPLFTSPVIMAAWLPDKTVIAASPAGIFSGYDGGSEVEASREALYHSEDSTPAPLVGGGGALAKPQRSLFQTDVVGLRCRARCAWCAYPGAIQFVEGVNWP